MGKAEQTFVAPDPDHSGEWPDTRGPLRNLSGGEGAQVTHHDAENSASGEKLIVDIDGFEGPLDLLLTLARHQKLDLSRISVLELAEQYLAFINRAQRLRLEVAADYLVMAAWLAYLKSRLLLPDPQPEDEPAAEELATRLALRLRRLQAVRDATAALFARDKLGEDVFPRGNAEALPGEVRIIQQDTLFDLLSAYTARRQKSIVHRTYTVRDLPVVPLKEARDLLEQLAGRLDNWSRLDTFLMRYLARPGQERSAIASSLSAALEMARDGIIDIRQDGHFGPIYMRRRTADASTGTEA